MLMSAQARSLCRAGGPRDGHQQWATAFERAGTTLAYLAAHGSLTRGLGAVIPHHVIFHANRSGLPTAGPAHPVPHRTRCSHGIE